jgi:hypothetical protein
VLLIRHFSYTLWHNHYLSPIKANMVTDTAYQRTLTSICRLLTIFADGSGQLAATGQILRPQPALQACTKSTGIPIQSE